MKKITMIVCLLMSVSSFASIDCVSNGKTVFSMEDRTFSVTVDNDKTNYFTKYNNSLGLRIVKDGLEITGKNPEYSFETTAFIDLKNSTVILTGSHEEKFVCESFY